MSGVVSLIGAITGLVVALTGLVGAVAATVKLLRKEPEAAAKTAAQLAIEAAADGEITPDELKAITEAENRK